LNPLDPRRKILSRDSAVRWRDQRPGRIVFTNGVFDLLHPGHIDVLTRARAAGDALIVGVNTDDSVRRLKGPSRPIAGQDDRACVLGALEAVDAVVLFDEDTPLDLIQELRPDVLVKGGDYSAETVVGADLVLARGGEVIIVPLTPSHSTTAVVNRLRSEGARGAT
jgi:rfaE bifunctional protein nucleotidyltransferase chain/domain